MPLEHLAADQGRFDDRQHDALGSWPCWDLNTASARPTRTRSSMWEAQFGDFVNGAQPIIDQFICSAPKRNGSG